MKSYEQEMRLLGRKGGLNVQGRMEKIAAKRRKAISSFALACRYYKAGKDVSKLLENLPFDLLQRWDNMLKMLKQKP